MKPTDELINQALQKALQRRFDSFEVQPPSRLSSEVLGAIKQSNFQNFKRFSTILILILLCGIGTSGVLNPWNGSESADDKKSNSVEVKSNTGSLSAILQTEVKTKVKQTEFREKLSNSEIDNLTNSQSKSSELKQTHTLPIQAPSGSKKPFDQLLSAANQPTRNADIYPPSNTQESTESAIKKEDKKTLLTRFDEQIPIESFNELSLTRLNIDVKKLNLHQPRTTRPRSIPTPEIIVQMPGATASQASPSRWRGVLSFTPTNTYQRLTILPQMHVSYQNFELPSLFSVQTAGFNLRGGIEKKGFQVLVNYSRFTQKIAYEIALDEYLVQPQGASAYTIAREGSSQIEEITFQLVGLSLQKKFFMPTPALPGFYIFTGATLSQDLTTSHNLAWGTVGIGKSWPVAPAASLSLIPQLGFGLNTVKTNNDAFKNRFYQLGLAVELTFGKN